MFVSHSGPAVGRVTRATQILKDFLKEKKVTRFRPYDVLDLLQPLVCSQPQTKPGDQGPQREVNESRFNGIEYRSMADILYYLVIQQMHYPGDPGVLARAQFEFAQRVTLGTSNILAPRSPQPGTLTNHIGVSDIGGAKSVAVLLIVHSNSLIYWLAPLAWIHHPLYSSDWS